MTLYHTAQTPSIGSGSETIVSEGSLSRLFNTLAYLVMTFGAAGAGVTLGYLWYIDLIPEEVGALGTFLGLLFCLALSLIGYTSLHARFTGTNWLLRIRPEELTIKFRSDVNARLPEPHPVVVSLAYSEIIWARKTREWVRVYSLSDTSSSTQYRSYYLDLKLRLRTATLGTLREAIDEEIRYEPGAGQPTMFRHHPVRLDGDVLRIQWMKGLRPELDTAMDLLRHHVSLEQALDLTSDFTKALTPTEAEQNVLELARRGEHLAAVGLVRRFFGLSLSDSKAYVEDLMEKQ